MKDNGTFQLVFRRLIFSMWSALSTSRSLESNFSSCAVTTKASVVPLALTRCKRFLMWGQKRVKTHDWKSNKEGIKNGIVLERTFYWDYKVCLQLWNTGLASCRIKRLTLCVHADEIPPVQMWYSKAERQLCGAVPGCSSLWRRILSSYPEALASQSGQRRERDRERERWYIRLKHKLNVTSRPGKKADFYTKESATNLFLALLFTVNFQLISFRHLSGLHYLQNWPGAAGKRWGEANKQTLLYCFPTVVGFTVAVQAWLDLWPLDSGLFPHH